MMKILHMTPPEIRNGVYQYIFNHMPFIDQKSYEFSFLTRSADELMATEEYAQYHFPVYQLNSAQRNGRAGFEAEIRGILSRGFDAVHLHTSAWRGFMIEEIAMQMGIPKVIVHSHSTGVDAVSEAQREEILQEHAYYRERFGMEYATDLWACSRLAAEWLFPEKIPRDRVRILPNAVDVDNFRFNRVIRDRIRGGMGLEDRIVVGNVGRYSYTKNQEFLVRCFAQAYKWNPRLFLIMVGQGDNISRVQGLVSRLGMERHILCLGWREDVPALLQAMDVFCLPSRFEGLPISVVEAQAAGMRCLVSDRVTDEVRITDLVEFLPLEEACWTEALAGCRLDMDRQSQNEKLAAAGYDIRTAAGRLEELYRE